MYVLYVCIHIYIYLYLFIYLYSSILIMVKFNIDVRSLTGRSLHRATPCELTPFLVGFGGWKMPSLR